MNNLVTINPELQIENVLFGTSESETIAVNEKTKMVAENIKDVRSVNGKKVEGAVVIGTDIYYWFRMPSNAAGKIPKYYYPIQYADIIFK